MKKTLLLSAVLLLCTIFSSCSKETTYQLLNNSNENGIEAANYLDAIVNKVIIFEYCDDDIIKQHDITDKIEVGKKSIVFKAQDKSSKLIIMFGFVPQGTFSSNQKISFLHHELKRGKNTIKLFSKDTKAENLN